LSLGKWGRDNAKNPIIYHLLSEGTTYQERGETFFEERDRDLVERRLVNQLTRLGYQVQLQPLAQAG
jgi:transposase